MCTDLFFLVVKNLWHEFTAHGLNRKKVVYLCLLKRMGTTLKMYKASFQQLLDDFFFTF